MLLLFHLLSLPKDLSNRSDGDTILHPLLNDSFSCPLIHLGLFILVALHGVGLAGASLPIGEYGRMKTIHDLVD